MKWEKKVEQFHEANEIYRKTKFCTIERAAIMAGLHKSTYYRIKDELESEKNNSTTQKPTKSRHRNYKHKNNLAQDILEKDTELVPSSSIKKNEKPRNRDPRKVKPAEKCNKKELDNEIEYFKKKYL